MAVTVPTRPDAHPFDAGPYAWTRREPREPRRGWDVRRPLAAAAVSWLPLAVLAAADGMLWRADARESLLLDLTVYARYLVAVPLLLHAEERCLPRLAAVARQFVTARLVVGPDLARFQALMSSARRRLDHRGLEAAGIVAAYAAAIVLGGVLYPRGRSTWVAPIDAAGGQTLSLAGWWRALVSQPIYLLLVGAWLWRVGVWARFLAGVARLDLQLVPTHPDRAGGLLFVSTSLPAFTGVAFALSAALAGPVAEEVVFGGRTLAEFGVAVAAACALVVLVFAAPLLAFAGPLRRARARGTFDYGALARALGDALERRWLRSGRRVDEAALAAADFSAAADLYAVVGNVHAMQIVPCGPRPLLALVAATVTPFIALAIVSLPADVLLAILRRVLS